MKSKRMNRGMRMHVARKFLLDNNFISVTQLATTDDEAAMKVAKMYAKRHKNWMSPSKIPGILK